MPTLESNITSSLTPFHMRSIIFFQLILLIQISNAQECTDGQSFYYEDLVPGEYDLSWVDGFGPEVAAWYGEHIVLLIEDEFTTDRNAVVMEQIVGVFDNLIEEFDLLTGHRPPHNSAWENRIRIDINYPKEGYGFGGAQHFDLGIHADIQAFNTTYNNWSNGVMTLDHVFFYELGRNYWFPLDRDPLQHDLNNPPHFQWVGGFNNFYPMIFTDRLSITDMTLGSFTLEEFIDFHMAHYEFYINSPEYNFENTWTTDLLPWDRNESLNILITAMLYDLYFEFGYEYIQDLIGVLQELPTPTDRKDYDQMITNWYVAVSIAAGKQMEEFFELLKWSIPENAIDRVDDYLSIASKYEKQELTISYEPFEYSKTLLLNQSTGFMSSWSGDLQLQEKSLTYPGIQTSGGSLVLNEENEDEYRYERLLQKGSCAESSIWLSFLIKANKVSTGACMVELGSSKLAPIGKTWGDEFAIAQISSGIKMLEDNVYWIVARTDIREGADDTYMWINPELDKKPSINEADSHLKSDLGGIGHVNILYQSHGEASYVIDEIRIGGSWEEVSLPTESFVIVDMTTSTSDLVNLETLQPLVYPNPVCAGCPINYDSHIRVFDVRGNALNVDFEAPVKPGMYVVNNSVVSELLFVY